MEYRRLGKGDIIQEGDEVDNCNNPWHDEPKWEKTICVGEVVPNPQFPAHRQYRRKITIS